MSQSPDPDPNLSPLELSAQDVLELVEDWLSGLLGLECSPTETLQA